MTLLSVVIPLYRVERYLPDLLGSLSAQRPGAYELEIIFVDDGSPDRSGEIAKHWLDRAGVRGSVIRQDNEGVSAARNAGLAASSGHWVTFPDSDDFFSRDYFHNVARFLQRHGSNVAFATTRLVRLREPETKPRDVHALKFRFMAGNRRVPMAQYPDFFQLNVASAFFKRERIVKRELSFRRGLHASEDALFVAEYLLGEDEAPVMGIVADARYVYRKRAAGDSAVDQFRNRPDSYIERFRDGYVPLMVRAAANGAVPEWLQSMFLYECQWILPVQMTAEGYARVLGSAEREVVLAVLADCARHVSERRLFEYDATALPLESRLLLQVLAGRSIPAWVGALRRRDELLVMTTDPGAVEIRPGDAESVKVETPDYFGQQVLHRLWAHAGRVNSVVSDGVTRQILSRTGCDTWDQQQDRMRRRQFSQLRRAIPARRGEVRVWKPVPGPFGSLFHRTLWNAQLLTRHARLLASCLLSK
ncbi:glycosyltransferase family 2 protein [Microbacterium luticocti]|uniref:glycosyltransferase family 2 protein n=1 Tax=Microbacterium luticocti TaxID=451764 RepID=UPI00048C731C|nr:glycosyltransferase [Microbacterium luticocti]